MRKSTEENRIEQSLKEKTALVTGASRGIGRAIAERLAKDGAYGVPPEDLGGQPSFKFVAQAFTGERLVKGFNHLVAAVLEVGCWSRRAVIAGVN